MSRAEATALREAERTSEDLAELGIKNQRLVLNGLFTASDRSDPNAVALEARGRAALEALPEGLADLPRIEVRLLPFGLIGVAALRALNDPTPAHWHVTATAAENEFDSLPPPLESLIPELSHTAHGVILTMGKGGVGKTTIATNVALALAKLGHKVHLSTTDPAAHLDLTLGERVSNLTVSRIDPEAETRDYTAEVMATAGRDLDAQGKALLEEDLRSPCTEEVAVFRAFARTVDRGKDGFVVLDTAPTGHTLLLLDATEAYHRDVPRWISCGGASSCRCWCFPACSGGSCLRSWPPRTKAGKLRFSGGHAHLAGADAFAAFLAPLRKTDWSVYSKRPFSGPKAVLAYLVQPEASSHPFAASSQANLPPIGCTRVNKLLVRLIRGKSCRR